TQLTMCSCWRRGSFETRSKTSRTLPTGLPLILAAFFLSGFSLPTINRSRRLRSVLQPSLGGLRDGAASRCALRKRCWLGAHLHNGRVHTGSVRHPFETLLIAFP